MVSRFHKQPRGVDTSPEPFNDVEDAPKTPDSCRALSQHPSSTLIKNMPPPITRRQDETVIPASAVSCRSGSTGVTTRASRRSSFSGSMGSGSFASSNSMEDMKHEVMANYLFQQQCGKMWVGEVSGEMEGIIIRKNKGTYVGCPPALAQSAFALSCSFLNLQLTLVWIAMTVNSRIIRTFLDCFPNATDVPLMNGLRIQILPSLDHLTKAKKNQSAAFLAAESLLIVWDSEPMKIISRAASIEDELMELVWNAGGLEGGKSSPRAMGRKDRGVSDMDEESGQAGLQSRPTHIMNGVLVGITLFLITVMLGAGFRQIATEIMVDQRYTRLALLVLAPIQIFFTLFFSQVIVGCLAQCFGPIRQMATNSRYYSATRPHRLTENLPHITIQCPVYKESVASVIAPTVKSVKQAMSTYELQGGSANMFVNDDGLQVVDEDERQARIDFYADHGIGWTARPKHGSDGFVRRGKFKKASNLNFGLMISNKVESKLSGIQRDNSWDQEDESREYDRCLKEVLEENDRAWADGNIRIGDYILLIDSDTRVPVDCLLDACTEMEQSPEVGILQFSSGVIQVVHTYFENGITFFTNLIYTAIRYTVSNGDVAPFVGHNAVLRWSAIQQVSFFDEDGYEKFWSESHVSEDFDMSLRLQVSGYIIRLAAWAGDGFKEGVSLTVYDELARWEKYAYGCNELLFHPLRLWLVRGPFTKLFRRFLFSNIGLTTKIAVISYIGTYYAIGAAWIMTVANYFAVGWFNGYLDKFYMDSWKVWFSIVIVFSGLGNIALAIMRYRISERSFLGALLENLKWILMLAIFLGGLSLHVSQALLAHFFEIDMTWGTTSKEAEFSNFFLEVPKVLRKFKFTIAFAGLGIVAMVGLAVAPFIPYSWHIRDLVAVLPLATVAGSHLLLPIALNPALMTFSW